MTDKLLSAAEVEGMLSVERAEHENLYAAYMKQGRGNFALQHEAIAAILGNVEDRVIALPDATPSPGEEAEEMLDKMIRTAEAQGALGVPCGPEGRAMPMHDWLVYGLKELRALPDATPSPGEGERLREAATKLLQIEQSIKSDISTAHYLRGNGASSEMREDDRDFRASLRDAFDALRAALHQKPEEESSTDSDRIIPDQD